MDASSYNYITPTGDVLVDVNTDDGSCIALLLGCLDATACNYSELANTGDNLCEYAAEGYDCYGYELSVAYEIGDLVEGGIVFYINETGEHGLVAALEDFNSNYQWGCSGTELSGAEAIGTGYQNTLDIVAGCSETNTAAFNALNSTTEGYTDWFLPSKDELIEMYSTIGQGGTEGNIGGFENDWYWSSSEYSSYGAWTVSFTSGHPYFFNKYNSYRVRIIRAF